MRLPRFILLNLLVLAPSLPLAAADPPNPSWDKVKSLVGVWEGTYEGQTARVSYRLVSNGTALMETMETPDSSQMVTLYHPDGTGLFMTHYCSIGNQPRMRSRGLERDALDFAYVDATNLGSADEPRMTRLVLRFSDADQLVQEWTSKEGAREQVSRFEFARKK